MSAKTLILGLGSNILTDAGIGIHIVDKLKAENIFPNLFYDTALISSLEILEVIKGYETVIIIDGKKTGDVEIGTVNLFRPETIPTLHLSNFHDFEFPQILELGNQIGYDIPANIFMIAVEIKDDQTFGDWLSKELSIYFPEIIKQIKDHIRNIISNKEFVVL
jgi:hydrogenase maturation protease